MKTTTFASTNKSKLLDIKPAFAPYNIDIILPNTPIAEVEETANTYAGNAILKAESFSLQSGLPCLADDSGIEIEALNGEPGVLSARFAGINATSEERNDKVLHSLANSQNRKARIVSIVCLWVENGAYLICEGEIRGTITHTPRGVAGWGYEPIFQVEGSPYTLAELRDHALLEHGSSFIKNHRTQSCEKLAKILTKYMFLKN
jgi:XTP/dITP diphosphohydrolase